MAARTAVFLLLGAAVNVAVAWGIMLAHGTRNEITAAIGTNSTSARPRPMTVAEEQWYHTKEAQGFLTLVLSTTPPKWKRGMPSVVDRRGIGWHEAVCIENFRYPGGRKTWVQLDNGERVQFEDTGEATMTTLSRCESGWPTNSLLIVFGKSSSAPPLTRADSGWALPACWGLFPRLSGYVVPVDLNLQNFAINTGFYAAMLWLLFAAPFALRRRRRIARGLCPACAYPVGASAVCTECGTPRPVSRLGSLESQRREPA